MNKFPFIVCDGIDGSGTSTHCRLLSGFLETQGFKVHLTHEPSNSEVGILLRKYLLDKNIPPTTDALLFAADRDHHYHGEIKKRLDEGFLVISDRYLESSIIYQSLQTKDISEDWIKCINKFVGKPDLTIILDIDPKIALERKQSKEMDKFENLPFLIKARELYLKRAKSEGYQVITSDDIIEIVQEKVQEIVIKKLKSLGLSFPKVN